MISDADTDPPSGARQKDSNPELTLQKLRPAPQYAAGQTLTLLQAFCTVRSERQLMEQLTCNMMLRWFVGLSMDAPVWDVTVFTKNRDRLLEGDIARGFLRALLVDPQVAPLLSDDHFSADGTLIG
jgi:transposase